jgi:hypothetical protein
MSLNRWKVLACTLTVGVGGLAVFATDPGLKSEAPKEPAPIPNLTVKPASPANGADTPPPATPVKGDEFELTIPVPPAPVKAEEPAKKPGDAPVFEPVDSSPLQIVPVKGEADAKDAKKPEPSKTDDVPTIAVPPVPDKLGVKDPPKTPAPATPNIPEIDVPAKKAPASVPTIILPDVKAPVGGGPPVPELKPEPPAKPTDMPVVVPGPKPDVPPVVVTPTPTVPEPAKVPATTATPKPTDAAKLKMLLRMGDGQPRFEIRSTSTTDLLLKVYGEKIEMQAPPDARSTLAGVTAVGRVRFTAPGIEGTCDHLRILSATGEVLLEGTIHLKSKHGKTWSEMTAEKMVYQIGSSGLTAPSTPKVTPAGYIQD